MIGEEARFRRYAASMLRVIAADRKLDYDSSMPFVEQVDAVYANPFATEDETLTKEKIVKRVLEKLGVSSGNGSDDTGGQTDPG